MPHSDYSDLHGVKPNLKKSTSRYHLHFSKIRCDHRTSTNAANHPTSYPCECDCNMINIMYFIFCQNQRDFGLRFSLAQYYLFKSKTKFDY